MTIRFAAPPAALAPRMSARRIREACGLPANDNGGLGPSDAMFHAALRHFAEHGLAAAQSARKQAEAAFFANDRQGYLWWLEICRALDRRMALELAGRVGGDQFGMQPQTHR
jgi:hypothetical protein